MEEATERPSFLGSAVRITTGHTVSSNSMVSRAYLTDPWRAVVVRARDGSPWLASTLDALGPDTDGLVVRGVARGGPPPEYASVTLVKVSIGWGDVVGLPGSHGEVHITNPQVVKHPGGASIGVLPLAKVTGFGNSDDGGSGPVPVDLAHRDGDLRRGCDDEMFDVVTFFRRDARPYWPITRRVRRASERGLDFLGQPGAVAIDLRLDHADAGSPAISVTGPPAFCGLVRPVGPELAMFLPSSLIAETIEHAVSQDSSA